jgi:YD repeat-containing protein
MAGQVLEATVPAVAQAVTADQVVGTVDKAGRVTSVSYTPEAAITGAASPDSRTFTLVNKGQAGSGTTVVATLALVSGVNAAAFDEKAVTVSATAANKVVVEGDTLVWVSTAVTGAGGLADPGGHVLVKVGASSYSDVTSSTGQVIQTEE